MKLNYALILCLLLLLNNCFAQVPLLAKFLYGGNIGYHETNAIVADEKNDAYIVGQVSDTILFGSKSSGTGYTERAYLLKYNALGEPQWLNLMQCDSGGNADAQTLYYDRQGHVYISGECFGTIHIGTDTYVTPGNVFSSFVAKYDTAGHYMWSIMFYTTYDTAYHGVDIAQITTDDSGNIYFLGGISINAMFDTINLNVSGNAEFVAKYNSDAHALWVRTFSTNRGSYANLLGISVDNAGNIFCMGTLSTNWNYNHTLYFGGDSLVANGFSEGYLLKYDSHGNTGWAQLINSPWDISLTSLGIDNHSIIYLIGSSDSIGGLNGYSFIKKFEPNGNLISTDSIQDPPLFSNTLKSGVTYTITSDSKLEKYDSNGVLLNANAPYIVSASSMCATEQETIFICGDMLGSLQAGRDVLIAREFERAFYEEFADTTYAPPGTQNIIKGIVYNDLNSNCVQDSGEAGISGIAIYCPQMSEYSVTDSIGEYKLNVDTGSFSIIEILPDAHSSNIHVFCPADTAYHISLKKAGVDTAGFNFSNSIQECSLLCLNFNNINDIYCPQPIHNYEINVSNFGSVSAYNALLTLHYPRNMLPISSVPAWDSISNTDSIIFFKIDSIVPSQTINIQMKDSLMCNSSQNYYLNYGYLYVAIIKPYNVCYASDTMFNTASMVEPYFLPIGTSNISSPNNYIKIYPNPTHNEFTIELPYKTRAFIECTTLLGQQVMRSEVTNASSEIEVNTGSLSNGIYFVKVLNENNELIGVGKFVKN